jgi:hypothetical protein
VPSDSAHDINRVKSSPAIPLHIPFHEVARSDQQQHPHEVEHEEASLASVSVITADNLSPAITTDPKRKKGGGSKQSQKMNRNPNPYDSSDGKRNLKSKRDDNSSGSSSLTHSVPPNFDLLAKFALEKER